MSLGQGFHGRPSAPRMLVLLAALLLVPIAGCLGGEETPPPTNGTPGEDPEPGEDAGEVALPALDLSACTSQLGSFPVPAEEAEAYLPEGFELVPFWNIYTGEVEDAGWLEVWSTRCTLTADDGDQAVEAMWIGLYVDTPEAYDTETWELLPIAVVTSSSALVERLHALEIEQAEEGEVTIDQQDSTVARAGTTRAEAGDQAVEMGSVVDEPEHRVTDLGWRVFGTDGEGVTGIVDVATTEHDILRGEAVLTEDAFFSVDGLRSTGNHEVGFDLRLEAVPLNASAAGDGT